MAAATGPRKSVSIYDYPEHLNPFHDDDHHNKIRFWTLGKSRLQRSNSITFQGIKDLKNSWAFRSFMRKGKKAPAQEKKTAPANGDPSPILYRRALQYSSTSPAARPTLGSPERPDRYQYGGSVTPLPRSRFQERLRSTSNYDVNSIGGATPRLARSEVSGSRLSVESTNPFDEEPPVRAPRRKKKRAPLPPGAADVSVCSVESTSTQLNESKIDEAEVDVPLNIELKIVEDEEAPKSPVTSTITEERTKEVAEAIPDPDTSQTHHTVESLHTNKLEIVEVENDKDDPAEKEDESSGIVEEKDEAHYIKVKDNRLQIVEVVDEDDSDVDILSGASFPKVDITKYRRNSSVNEDDIKLRRGNIEDYVATNKRSKSLNNGLNSGFVTFDINLNENIKADKDANDNETPQKVVCKMYVEPSRKLSLDNSISSTEKEFIEIDRATRELEREISKLNTALIEDDDLDVVGARLSVSEIKRKFDNNNSATPNPIPKPRRSNHGSSSPLNGTY
ncbi:uncharacterized protein LOC105390830 [Plutella xylostella]|uniref:uncharacterized protein LOC105390830 n=1 Tax=Plutella xylostella TaxID=51655 RepID=UPI00203318E0|nr:uncharacterized protein LOC105390830 [Plutella xylostella]